MKIRKLVPFATNMLAFRAMRKMGKATYLATKKVASVLVRTDQNSPSRDQIVKQSVVPLIPSRASLCVQQVCTISIALFLFACSLHSHGKEMQGKMQQIKKIINCATTSRAAPSGSTWIDMVGTTFEAIKVVNCCRIISTATIVYLVASNLVILQNHLIQYHQETLGDDEVEIDKEEGFVDCNQGLDDQSIARECESLAFMPATSSSHSGCQQQDMGYDSDSYWMAIDNCCSACISNCIDDFEGPTKAMVARVKGIGGVQVMATRKGTLKWSNADDDCKIHMFLIEDSEITI
jgi:hypothetical protein